MINPKSLIEMLESSYDGIWITAVSYTHLTLPTN